MTAAVSSILRRADELHVELRPDHLPESARYLYEGILDSLIPRLAAKKPERERMALDATFEVCSQHAGERLAPTHVDVIKPTVERCLVAHGGSTDWLPHTMAMLDLACRGGLRVPTLKGVADLLRDEQIRRAFKTPGAGYPDLARRFGLSVSQVRNITAARSQAKLVSA